MTNNGARVFVDLKPLSLLLITLKNKKSPSNYLLIIKWLHKKGKTLGKTFAYI